MWILLCLAFGSIGVCRGQEKIAISELLESKTRTQALQQFVLRSDPAAEIHGWKDLAKFSKDHQDIGVLASADRRIGKRLYAVTWKPFSIAAEIPRPPGAPNSKADYDRLFRSPEALISPADFEYSVFDEDGLLAPLDGAPSAKVHGVVMDLNADGALEVLEDKAFESVRYLMVRQLTGQKAIFAVAYAWGTLKDHGEPWEYGIRSETGDGIYEIHFGPKLGDAILSEVVFRWDAAHGTWGCESPGDHIRVLGQKNPLNLSNVWEDIVKLAAETPLEKPVEQKPKR